MSLPPIVVVGASAGGVGALQTLVAGLPTSFAAAVFVVNHIPAHTPSRLADILGRCTTLPTAVAEDGEPIRPGRIVVACADRHLMVDADRIRVTRGPRECRVRPAIDVLFRSAAAAHGRNVVGVILTGTMDDGTAGLWAVKDRGGIALVQEPGTAEFASMPESAIRNVKVDRVLPLAAMASEIVRRVESLPHAEASEGAPERMTIENHIARGGNGLRAGALDIGEPSSLTCPECHGALARIAEGPIIRFRCHTGHAFSTQTLLADVDDAIDIGLWNTLRALEERMLLLDEMADLAERTGDAEIRSEIAQQAREAQGRVELLRGIVLDPGTLDEVPGG